MHAGPSCLPVSYPLQLPGGLRPCWLFAALAPLLTCCAWPACLLMQSSSRRPRGSTPLPTRQAVPEYLDEPLDPNSKSSFIGVRLARNCRGWAAKIKVGLALGLAAPLCLCFGFV